MSDTQVSLCMIVKNEEEVLARALDSAQGLYDELIIVDTGSTDATVEIAESYGAKVMHFTMPPPGHLGAARMVGIDIAAGEWIVMLDADEVIRDAPRLRQQLLDLPGWCTGAVVRFENHDRGVSGHYVYLLRCLRRGLYRCVHRAHESPYYVGNDAHPRQRDAMLRSVIFEHRAPPGRTAAGKHSFYLEMLLKDMEERPDDPHPLYHLHVQFYTAGDLQQAWEWGHKYLTASDSTDWQRGDCYCHMAQIAITRGDLQAAVEFLHRAAAVQPHRRLWWVLLADMYMAANEWTLAFYLLSFALTLSSYTDHGSHPMESDEEIAKALQQCQAGELAMRKASVPA